MSFYHFPTEKSVNSWSQNGGSLRWSTKTNRIFTHRYRFNEAAKERWSSFKKLFASLDDKIDFYLFQVPPQTTPKSAERIVDFAESTGLGKRFALEFRNPEWFNNECEQWAREKGITLVSVDAPELPNTVFVNDGLVCFRIHGKTSWYSHNYSRRELEKIASKIRKAEPEKAYVFFNNDHNMLENARAMLGIMRKQSQRFW